MVRGYDDGEPHNSIPLDPQTARAYNAATPEEKRKIQALLSLWLRELAAGEYPSLQQVLDEAGRKARGLTPEMLDSLLKGASLRYVFDTNVIVSALLLPDSKPRLRSI